jgi:cardiolipin synthase A/B
MNRLRKKANGYIMNNQVQLIRGGKIYFERLLEMIIEAKESIQLQVYILDDDETGKKVTHALRDAARRKVMVYLMADGYASQKLSHAFIKELTEAGIHFRFFEPLFRNRKAYFGRRMHHKVVVVDNQYAMVGGINISDNYNDMPGRSAWLDFAIFIEGDIAKSLCGLCKKTWEGFTPIERINPCKNLSAPFQIESGRDCQLRIRRNDWVMKKSQVSRSYTEMFAKANKEIFMMSGYFLPGRIIRRGLKKAVQRGVDVKLVLAGVSDVKIAKYAERYIYGWVFRNNIALYEYKPHVLHGKVATYDGIWATIGSYNVNDISAYASVELNIDINNTAFAAELQETFERIIREDCVLVTEENFRAKNSIFNQIREYVSYMFIRLLFYLFTFNFKQRDS